MASKQFIRGFELQVASSETSSSESPSYIFCSVVDLFWCISSSVSSVSWLFWIRERFCASNSVKIVMS